MIAWENDDARAMALIAFVMDDESLHLLAAALAAAEAVAVVIQNVATIVAFNRAVAGPPGGVERL